MATACARSMRCGVTLHASRHTLLLALSALGALGACSQTQVLDLFPPDAARPAAADAGSTASSAPNTSSPASTADAGPQQDAPSVVVETDVNLSERSITGRDCARGELVTLPVVGISGNAVEVGDVAGDECLRAGDELLLLWLQGTREDNSNVGRVEFRTLSALAGQVLQLEPLEVGTATLAFDGQVADEQRIIVQRVPHFGSLWIRERGALRAATWDGALGGVLALRALDELRVDGAIRMDAAGFRGGASTEPVESPGQQGESISGLGVFDTAPNLGGGGGGIADQTRGGCQQDGYPGGGAGHALLGSDAIVQGFCDGVGRGLGGAAYATTRHVFLGSGGGSAGTDNVRVDNPPGGAGGRGGGVIWLNAPKISGGGRVSAEGEAGVGDPPGVECLGGSTVDCYDHSGPGGGGSGGSIVLETLSLELASVSVRGGDGGNGNDEVAGNGGNGADGVVLGADLSALSVTATP